MKRTHDRSLGVENMPQSQWADAGMNDGGDFSRSEQLGASAFSSLLSIGFPERDKFAEVIITLGKFQ